MKQVRKRDGRLVSFAWHKIFDAMYAAYAEVSGQNEMPGFVRDTLVRISEVIADRCGEVTDVEDIQDMVEKELMAAYPDVAKAYILYRDKRSKARNHKSDNVIAEIVAAKKNDVTRENANMNAGTPAGMMYKIGSERSKEYTDEYLLSDEVKRYMFDNLIHVHDKDHLALGDINCLQHPLDHILKNGFVSGHGESRPAKRIETASIMACISLESAQNEMFGGQSIPAFDFYMAPYVRATYIEEVKKLERYSGEDYSNLYHAEIIDYLKTDELSAHPLLRTKQHAINLTVDRVHQAMEALIHNLNQIHSRGGNQVTFSSINYGTETSAEGRCVIRELLLSTWRGVGDGRTAIFPIQVMLLKEGVNRRKGDPNFDLYKLACRVTAKRFFPNFLNLDASYNKDELWRADDPERYKHQVYTMGCVGGDENIYIFDKSCPNDAGDCFSISHCWDVWAKEFGIHPASDLGYDEGEYVNLCNVGISDGNAMVDCIRIIRNPSKDNWLRLFFNNKQYIDCTEDHPWYTNNRGVVKAKDLVAGDEFEWCDPDEAAHHTYDLSGRFDERGEDDDFDPILKLVEMKRLPRDSHPYSYDVTTSSGYFNVSGIRSHNCRTRVYEDRHGERTSIGRGNLSFTSINLPGIALSVKDIKDESERLDAFAAKLEETMDVVARQLHDRYELQCRSKAEQFPMLMGGMWKGSEKLKPTDEVHEILKHGTLGVGFIGLAEALVALIGKHHGESERAQKLGIEIIWLMHYRVKGYANQYDLNYSLFATPAEGLSGKFTKKDREKYGIVPGVTDRDFYTNSTHVPVYYECTPQHKFEVEGPYHKLCTGGHIGYVEFDGDPEKNVEAIEQVVDIACDNDLGYFSINHWNTRCNVCGHETNEPHVEKCPKCGSEDLHVLQRITGYLVGGSALKWNEGKLAELNARVTHG